MFTFPEHYDLTGKKIVPLCTNEGSGPANREKALANACKGAAVAPGLSVRGHQAKVSKKTITAWPEENA